MNYNNFKPVRCITPKGKILVAILRTLFSIRKILGFPQWYHAVPNHHEDALTMTFREKLYLGYKYYYQAIVKDDCGGKTAEHFKQQTLKIDIPADFVPQQSIHFSAGGDLIPYDCITKENCLNLWDEAGDFFFNNDIVFANLETVADKNQETGAAPEVMLGDMFFNVHEETFNIFSGNGKYKQYDVLSTANNHSLDFGREGIIATLDFLKEKNIAATGTAYSKEKRDNFPIIERKGIKTAFIAYTYSLNRETLPEGEEWLCNYIFLNKQDADISLIVHQAKLARQRGADIIVASLHMGCAYQVYPQQYTIENMHRICLEADIDVLIGGHPHNAQPLELYQTTNKQTGRQKQHVIVYSLGDFIAYDIYKWCHLPLILKLTITKGTTGVSETTIVSGIQVKPFYFYRNKKGELRLADLIKAEKNLAENFPEKEIQQEVAELSRFFHEFIIRNNQSHILG
jgi:poly-gamma-glutamate synthesis protein (capsule biosynthesis protein)